MQQRVLVLGADNFLGRRVVVELGAGDWAEPVAGDPAAGEGALDRTLDGIDAVVNCFIGKASEISAGARDLFAAAARSTAKPRVVHLSSMSVYGDVSGVVDETAALSTQLGAYAEAKVAAEGFAAGYANSVILRPGCEYGPECPQWSVRMADWLTARRLGDLGAEGDGYCNLLHIDDLVAAILSCLKLTQLTTAVFNVSTPDPPTWNEYLIRYGRALGAVPIRRISQRRLKIETRLLAPPLKVLELALGAARLGAHRVPPAMPPSLLRLMRQEIKLDVTRAERVLGLRWTPLEAGLEKTAGWYLHERRRHAH
ncbi:MAG: NAD(P)-dependent oxidoreductase [Steroidobacteraceae bacterium]